MKTQLIVAAFCASGILMTGCKSSASTMFTRDEMNSRWDKFEQVDGVPITVKIPTHLKVYVYEKHFLEVDRIGADEAVSLVKLPVVLRDFAHEFVYTEKVVMVDFKRPAAGAFNLEVDFTDDQYLQKVQHDITDETIARVTEFVGTAFPLLGDGAAVESAGENVEVRVKEVKSVVAVGMFEVDAPDFECQVQEFLDCHINKSHDAMSAPPSVESFHRAPVEEVREPNLCNPCRSYEPIQSYVPQSTSLYSGQTPANAYPVVPDAVPPVNSEVGP